MYNVQNIALVVISGDARAHQLTEGDSVLINPKTALTLCATLADRDSCLLISG